MFPVCTIDPIDSIDPIDPIGSIDSIDSIDPNSKSASTFEFLLRRIRSKFCS